ncbi:hypothetical protein [Croceivirga radicis]|nr:hypothetical protein [Croceivirga radicis]
MSKIKTTTALGVFKFLGFYSIPKQKMQPLKNEEEKNKNRQLKTQ